MFYVKDESDGYRVYSNGWGVGYTFTHREFAEAAARALNDNVALDQKAGPSVSIEDEYTAYIEADADGLSFDDWFAARGQKNA